MPSEAGQIVIRKPQYLQNLKIKRKHPKAGVCLRFGLNKWRDFSRKLCHHLATMTGGQNLTSFISNTLWRMSL